MINRLKINDIVEYALLLGNSTTIAKVGFYLSLRKKELNISEDMLSTLQKNCPRSPHYIEKIARKEGKFIDAWNIIVPSSLISKDWEE